MTSIDYRLISGLNAILTTVATTMFLTQRRWGSAVLWAGITVACVSSALLPEDESDSERTRRRRTTCILILVQVASLLLGTWAKTSSERHKIADYERCLEEMRILGVSESYCDDKKPPSEESRAESGSDRYRDQ